MGRLDGLMLWQLMNINDKIPTAEEVAKAIVDEEVKRREDEKAYWEAWDKACKEKVIERLRNHEEGLNFLTLQKQPIYPNMTQDEQADLLERGDLRLVAPTQPLGPAGAIWTDENREEAKNFTYLKFLIKIFLKELIGLYRRYNLVSIYTNSRYSPSITRGSSTPSKTFTHFPYFTYTTHKIRSNRYGTTFAI